MAQIGDILARLGRGELLTESEQQQIRLWGNQTEFNNAYISGIQNGRSTVNALEISASRLYVNKEVFSGLAARYHCYNVTAPVGYTDTVNWVADYADAGFSTDGTGITIPETGVYLVAFQISWDNTASSTGIRDTGAKTNGDPARPQSNALAATGASYTYVRAYDEIEYQGGDVVSFTHYQAGGATVSFDGWVMFRKIR